MESLSPRLQYSGVILTENDVLATLALSRRLLGLGVHSGRTRGALQPTAALWGPLSRAGRGRSRLLLLPGRCGERGAGGVPAAPTGLDQNLRPVRGPPFPLRGVAGHDSGSLSLSRFSFFRLGYLGRAVLKKK